MKSDPFDKPLRDPDRYYTGTIGPMDDCFVTLTEWGHTKALKPRTEIVNHSPLGLAWGYGGSGPAQLALAILVDVVGAKDATAGGIYQDFKWARIAPLDQHIGWTMSAAEVSEWYQQHVDLGCVPPDGGRAA